MRFCMVTTFFGPHAFGGDAIYVDHLTRGLLRRGHEVEVVYDVDAYRASGGRSERPYDPPPGLRIHALKSRAGVLAPLWSQQTGHLAPGSPLSQILAEGEFDVVHFHNMSLMGAPASLELGRAPAGPIRLLSAHEHWLVCPMHILWKLDREVCERPQCIRCTLHGRRLPQLWRYTGLRDRALATLDAVICASQAAIDTHRARGIEVPLVCLPYFVPEDWSRDVEPAARERPYFVVLGRLIKAKGVQDVIQVMRQLPEADLLVAGEGPYGADLQALAAGLENVHFLGQLEGREVARLVASACAVVVPSLCYEVFALVQLEAFTVGTPLVSRRLGVLEEVLERSGAGFLFSTEAELLAALRGLLADPALRDRLGAAGRQVAESEWSEAAHFKTYFGLIEQLAAQRGETTALIP